MRAPCANERYTPAMWWMLVGQPTSEGERKRFMCGFEVDMLAIFLLMSVESRLHKHLFVVVVVLLFAFNISSSRLPHLLYSFPSPLSKKGAE